MPNGRLPNDRRRDIWFPAAHDEAMVELSKMYRVPVNEVYRRAVAIYLGMQRQVGDPIVSMPTGWPDHG